MTSEASHLAMAHVVGVLLAYTDACTKLLSLSPISMGWEQCFALRRILALNFRFKWHMAGTRELTNCLITESTKILFSWCVKVKLFSGSIQYLCLSDSLFPLVELLLCGRLEFK